MEQRSNTDGDALQHLRTNLFIASWTLILLAAGISVGLPGPSGLIFAAPAGIVGGVMLIWAISMKDEPRPMSDKQIKSWAPDAEELAPGAGGSIMYRVDTTLDKPIRTSILCGACGHLEWNEGPKPDSYACVECGQALWEEEE